MRKYYFILVLLLLADSVSAMRIEVSTETPYDQLYLASYFGKGVMLVDSLSLKDGQGVLAQADNLPEGIYFLTDALGQERMEFLLGQDQEFDLSFYSIGDSNVQIVGSKESETFQYYRKAALDSVQSRDKINVLAKRLSHEADQTSCLHVVLKALVSPHEAPLMLQAGSMDAYDYRIAHFWDNYDLGDARLLRTPFFVPRLHYFLHQVLLPREDKIMEGVLPLLDEAESNDSVLQLVAAEVLSFAVEDKIMGIDALGYEVISRYYLSGRLGELPSKQRAMLEDYVKHTKDCRLGHKGKDILLESWDQGPLSLYATKAQYTLLLFWEPDCDYCKKVVPLLNEAVFSRYKDKGLQIFAVNTQRDYSLWKNFISDNELFSWKHGYLPVGVPEFMTDYGVQGTPYMYLLDKDKIIVAKNVKPEFLNSMLNRLFATGSIY